MIVDVEIILRTIFYILIFLQTETNFHTINASKAPKIGKRETINV